MKPSQILREAARLVERGKYSGGCAAILWARVPYEDRGAAREYFHLLRPSKSSDSGYWWDFDPQGKSARIIGLCLAAAIAESEGE